MKLIALIFYIFLASCITNPHAPEQRGPAQENQILNQADVDGEIYFNYVKGLIKAQNIKSVDRLLGVLPEKFRQRHVLMFDSPSLQNATYQNPRVLLIFPKARFVMTFNGDPSQTGYEGIETMRFTYVEGKPKFIFEEIVLEDDFAARKKYLTDTKQEAQLLDLHNRGKRQGPNPDVCLACHRKNPRPNWESYSFWPGAYGQFDDSPFQDRAFVIDPYIGTPTHTGERNERPARELPIFLKAASKRNRYGQLLNLKSHQTLKEDHPGSRTTSEHLAAFNNDLSQMNAQRIVQMILDSKEPRRNAGRLLWAVWDCAKGGDLANPTGTYQRIKNEFQDTDVPWQDFFMNFVRNVHNSFNSPSGYDSELTYFLTQKFPEFKSLFEEFPYHYPTYTPIIRSFPVGSRKGTPPYYGVDIKKIGVMCIQIRRFIK